ncbi:MAG: AAA domain-containing protein [Rhodobacterales bacterium]|nr:AAA domain-containing protein [Rhodobacterales bacterium]
MSEVSVEDIEARVREVGPVFESARNEMARVLVGQRYMVDRLLIGLLANGHVLIEGVPGLAKTTAVKALAGSLSLQFSRIQFTPDLLPADLIGTQIYEPKTGDFSTRLGPTFANVVLADEINRAPPKVQSALLEAMQERQVTIGNKTFDLPKPFLVLATQNPLEQEGTYPLPEAQTDRFMLKLNVGYPSFDEEIQILQMSGKPTAKLAAVASEADLIKAQSLVQEIKVTDVLQRYIVSLVRATRDPASVDKSLARTIEVGASPRASIALAAAARAHAFLDERGYTLPEDVKAIGRDVLRHRVLPTYEAEADGLTSEQIVDRILDAVEMP